MKIKKINNVKYYLAKPIISFETEDGYYEIDSEDVLELAYGLFDSLGFDYSALELVEIKLKGE